MSWKVRFQTSYKSGEMYGTGTVYDSACGPSSLVNALLNAGIADVSILDMCKFSVNAGARIPNSGTDMTKLLKAAASKYGFTYEATSRNAELKEHLKGGGVAIMNQGSEVKVFANGGHYVAAVAIDDRDIVTVLDSYWTSTKYKTWPTNHAARTNQDGVVETSLYKCGRATIDRDPSYYLISKKVSKPKTVKTTDKVTARAKAGTASNAVGQINEGVKLTVQDETANWYKVQLWLPKKYTESSGNNRVKVTEKCNLRKAAGKANEIVGTINAGADRKVVDKTENWVKVNLWVPKKHAKIAN